MSLQKTQDKAFALCTKPHHVISWLDDSTSQLRLFKALSCISVCVLEAADKNSAL